MLKFNKVISVLSQLYGSGTWFKMKGSLVKFKRRKFIFQCQECGRTRLRESKYKDKRKELNNCSETGDRNSCGKNAQSSLTELTATERATKDVQT